MCALSRSSNSWSAYPSSTPGRVAATPRAHAWETRRYRADAAKEPISFEDGVGTPDVISHALLNSMRLRYWFRRTWATDLFPSSSSGGPSCTAALFSAPRWRHARHRAQTLRAAQRLQRSASVARTSTIFRRHAHGYDNVGGSCLAPHGSAQRWRLSLAPDNHDDTSNGPTRFGQENLVKA